jgi:hypothetical protein
MLNTQTTDVDGLSISRYPIIVFIFVLLWFHHAGNACTICVKADKDIILVGNNEDYYEPLTKIWFFPESPDAYGRVIWGFDRYLHKYQGGMNDQGLFVDINAVGFTGWVDDPEKPDLPGDYIEYILIHCASVEDVVKLFGRFDLDLGWIKLVLADAQGESAIFEWLDGKLNIIKRKGDYQVSTNYLSPKEHTEPRNQIAVQILGSQKEPSVDLIRKTLAATSYDVYFGQTLYSTICDLKSKKFYLYHFHYFEEVVTFDLKEELPKGAASYQIPSLFQIRTQNEYFFNRLGTQLGARDLSKIIQDEGIEKAIQKFYEMKEKKRTFHQYDFPEWRLRSLGLNYLANNEVSAAIGIFKLNTELFSDSRQTYSDLADAYVRKGDKKSAIQNYQKALNIKHDDETLEKLNKLKNENQ